MSSWWCVYAEEQIVCCTVVMNRLVRFVYILSACRRPSHRDLNGWANGCWVLAS